MNIENLATVFAPSLFRDETVFDQSFKKKRDMQVLFVFLFIKLLKINVLLKYF